MNLRSRSCKTAHLKTLLGMEPVAGQLPRVLILGSFPSEKSLLHNEYYGNPQNQFWKIMAALCAIDNDLPYAARIDQIRKCDIALWDIVRSCSRIGSVDANISNPVFNDINGFIATFPTVRLVALNGTTAARYYSKTAGTIEVPFIVLPSTSPANTRYTLEEKTERWSVIKKKYVVREIANPLPLHPELEEDNMVNGVEPR